MEHGIQFDVEKAADLLGLLAHDKRLMVLKLIGQNEWDVNSLAREVNLSQSALSQHLKKMRDANVVRIRRDAQTIYYSCANEAVAKVLATLEEIYAATPVQTARSAA